MLDFIEYLEEMFSDYKTAIVEDYHLKKADGSLSLNLMNPTPSGLKNESLIILETRTTKEDFKTLRLFFGERENEGDYERALRNTDVNIFKPLCNFLKGKTNKPDEKNIEMLAWLIDFSPRPYKLGFTMADIKPSGSQTVQIDDQESQTLSRANSTMIYGGSKTTGDQIMVSDKPAPLPEKNLLTDRRKIFIILFVLISGVIALALNKTRVNSSLSFLSESDRQCMYWSGEQFIEADCLSKLPNVELIALERSKLDHFRKIKRPDTLTENHINKVWYFKTGNKLELFTMEGKHPEQFKKRLRPLSRYMYEKYVVSGKVIVD